MYRCAERYMTMGPLVSQVRDEGDAGRQRRRRPSRGGTWKLTGRISRRSSLVVSDTSDLQEVEAWDTSPGCSHWQCWLAFGAG